jgi:hypothetical protein
LLRSNLGLGLGLKHNHTKENIRRSEEHYVCNHDLVNRLRGHEKLETKMTKGGTPTISMFWIVAN